MQLLNAQQIHQWDVYTIEHEPVASIDLMERAAQRCTDYIIEHNYSSHPVKIFCAKGNNGGDGLAIARQLTESGIDAFVYILEFGTPGTEDFQINLHRLHQLSKNIHFIQAKEFFPVLDKDDFIIDALYGSGLNRPLENLSAELVTHLNNSVAKIISIDVPSGMFIDKSSKGNTIVKALTTLSFQSMKLCFLFAENADFFGEVEILDIGLHPDFLENNEPVYSVVTKNQISGYIQPRKKFSHKGNYGHAFLIAGSKGKMGAAVLAAKACLRTGAGLLTIHTPEIGLNILQTAVPEAMCNITNENIEYEKFSAVAIGPGIGTNEEAANILEKVLQQFQKPLVIDADALNIIAAKKELLQKIPEGSILTPHPKEFERLFGKSNNDFERAALAIEASAKNPFIIILKGHHTLTACNGKGWFNITGNAAMATAGSGDTLTGVIVSLLAQGYNSFNAALTAVFLHGHSADLAVNLLSSETLMASDISDYLGQALHSLKSKNNI